MLVFQFLNCSHVQQAGQVGRGELFAEGDGDILLLESHLNHHRNDGAGSIIFSHLDDAHFRDAVQDGSTSLLLEIGHFSIGEIAAQDGDMFLHVLMVYPAAGHCHLGVRKDNLYLLAVAPDVG